MRKAGKLAVSGGGVPVSAPLAGVPHADQRRHPADVGLAPAGAARLEPQAEGLRLPFHCPAANDLARGQTRRVVETVCVLGEVIGELLQRSPPI